MTGLESALAFVLGILQRIAATIVVTLFRQIDPARLFPLRAYRRRLLLKMEDMPFLYKDMRLSARDDYVEPQVGTAIDEIQRSVGNPELNYQRPFMRFHESRRALLFGEGGYGKTTLFRHLTIRCLQQTRRKPVLDGRRLVPVFVALKTARTSSDFPILDAIRRSDEYFDGELGLRRLRKLAKRNRLLVFLDGYDEMPHAGGMEHVQKELKTIFGRYSSRTPDFFEASEHGATYRALQNCRIYLSSRREFFFYSSFYVGSEVQKWIIKGLEDRRIELVEKIFDNYRSSSEISRGLDLDAELFMQELKRTADGELHQLSRSPLFLTVMCFVYVSEIRKCGVSNVFRHGAYEIINECIGLLVSELDVAKSKGLTGAQRTALHNRRSAYPDEKLAFLRYFSVYLYEQSIGLFDRALLMTAAERFFRSCTSPDRDEILRGILDSDPTVNVVEQIILSGIFVLVDRHKNVDYFDFPHRRFRETLAVSFFNDSGGARALVGQHLLDSAYGELILVYVEQSKYRDAVFNGLIREIVEGTPGSTAGDLFASALERVADREAEEWFSHLLESVDPARVPELPTLLLKYTPHGVDYCRLVAEKVKYAIVTGNDRLLALWINIAGVVDLGVVQEALLLLVDSLNLTQFRLLVYSRLASIDSKNGIVIEAYLRRAALEEEPASALLDLYMLFYAGRDTNAQKQFMGFLSLMVSKLSKCEGTGDILLLRGAIGEVMNVLGSGGKADLGPVPPVPKTPWRQPQKGDMKQRG